MLLMLFVVVDNEWFIVFIFVKRKLKYKWIIIIFFGYKNKVRY